MAKIIAVNRKYITLALSVLVICLVGFGAINVWKNTEASVDQAVTPEIQMLGVTVEPKSIVKDLDYGSITLKGAQVIPAATFDLVATIQNTTNMKMTNIPIELEVRLVDDETQKISKLGNLESLDPGATARVTFRQVKALGDAKGKNPVEGQHIVTLRVKPNPAGGVNQLSEASFRFLIDSTVKVPQAK